MAQKNRTFHLTTPLETADIKNLRASDLVYLSGVICTGRDHFHKRILEITEEGKPLPPWLHHLHGGVLYHMGPIMRTTEEGTYELVSGGPTTSARMNPYQTKVAQILGLRAVVGKGGMTGIHWDKIPAVYLQLPGGVGALVSKFVESVLSVEWLDLGAPEAAWLLQVKNFGPLLVGIDTHGGTLFS